MTTEWEQTGRTLRSPHLKGLITRARVLFMWCNHRVGSYPLGRSQKSLYRRRPDLFQVWIGLRLVAKGTLSRSPVESFACPLAAACSRRLVSEPHRLVEMLPIFTSPPVSPPRVWVNCGTFIISQAFPGPPGPTVTVKGCSAGSGRHSCLSQGQVPPSRSP